jgi:hypothetical protein
MTARSSATGTIAVFAFAVFSLCRDAYAEEPLCNFSSLHACSLTDPTVGGPCLCDLTALRPLQGAVGIKEVDYKAAEIETSKDPEKQCRKLVKKAINVVVGPGPRLFVTDHHHGALALWKVESDRKEPALIGVCKIVNSEKGLPPTFVSEDEFWQIMGEKRLVRPYDEKGVKLASPSALPHTLEALPDDPYRSLAWLVRETGGFCTNGPSSNVQKEFLEFQWADFFREKKVPVERVQVWDPKGKADPVVRDADALAHSSEAANLPGYTNANCSETDED